MRVGFRLFLSLVAVLLLLAVTAGSATASRSFSIVGGGKAILAISLTLLTFSGSNGVNVISDVTLHGSIHSLIAKTRGALAGVITGVLIGRCTNTFSIPCRVTALVEPRAFWHLQLLSFTGTLPVIRTITLIIVRSAFLILFNEELECLYLGDVGATGSLNASGVVERLEPEPNRNSVPLFRAANEEFFRTCPREGRLTGGFRLSPTIGIRLH